MGQYYKLSPALITPLSALITPFPVNPFPNIIATNFPNNIGINQYFYSFPSFLVVSLNPFISNPDSSRDSTIFIMSFISSFENDNAVFPDP